MPEKQCPNCQKVFNDNSKFMFHLRTHLRYYPYECLECGASFNTKNRLLMHQKSHKNKAKRFKCDSCDERFTSTYRRSQHLIEHIHTPGEPILCIICGKEFPSFAARVRHCKNHTISCTLCKLYFKEKRDFMDHLQTVHSGKGTRIINEIELPEASFANKDISLTLFNEPSTLEEALVGEKTPKHLMYKSNPYICFICEDYFKSKSDLKEHFGGHRIYFCSHCPKFFATFQDQQSHEELCTFNTAMIQDLIQKATSEAGPISSADGKTSRILYEVSMYDDDYVEQIQNNQLHAYPDNDTFAEETDPTVNFELEVLDNYEDDSGLNFENPVHRLWLSRFVDKLKLIKPVELRSENAYSKIMSIYNQLKQYIMTPISDDDDVKWREFLFVVYWDMKYICENYVGNIFSKNVHGYLNRYMC